MLAVTLLALVVGVQSDHQKEIDNALRMMQGDWVVDSLVVNGESMVRDDSAVKVTIRDNMLVIKGGDLTETSLFKLQTVGDTSHLVLSNKAGVTFPGIYSVTKGKLVICYATRKDQERPKTFTSNANSNTVLMVLKR